MDQYNFNVVKEYFTDVIDRQIRANDPDGIYEIYHELTDAGYTHDQVIRIFAGVLTQQVRQMILYDVAFDDEMFLDSLEIEKEIALDEYYFDEEPFPQNLSEALARCWHSEELNALAEALGVSGDDVVVEDIASSMLQENTMRQFLSESREEEYAYFIHLMEEGPVPEENHQRLIQSHLKYYLIADRDHMKYQWTQDVRECFEKVHNDALFHQVQLKTMLKDSLRTAALLYGVFPGTVLQTMIAGHKEFMGISMEEIWDAYLELDEDDRIYWILSDQLVYRSLIEEDDFDYISKHVMTEEYKIPDVETIHAIGADGYKYDEGNLELLKKALSPLKDMERERFLRELYANTLACSDDQTVEKTAENYDLYVDTVMDVFNIYQNIFDGLPRVVLRGKSPMDMENFEEVRDETMIRMMHNIFEDMNQLYEND